MASLTMTASFLGGAAPRTQESTARGGAVVVRAMRVPVPGVTKEADQTAESTSTKRRDLVFAAAAAAAAACSLAKIAVAAEEPKRGTLEAKKKYGPICVSMPTARICHK